MRRFCLLIAVTAVSQVNSSTPVPVDEVYEEVEVVEYDEATPFYDLQVDQFQYHAQSANEAYTEVSTSIMLNPFVPDLDLTALNGECDESVDRGCHKKRCWRCTGEAAKYIMGMVYKGLNRWCRRGDEEVTLEDEKCDEKVDRGCGKKRAFCRWYRDHTELVLGYFAVMIRPLELGFGWCSGHGECRHHDAVQQVMVPEPEDDEEMKAMLDSAKWDIPYTITTTPMNGDVFSLERYGEEMTLNKHLKEAEKEEKKRRFRERVFGKKEDEGIVTAVARNLASFWNGEEKEQKDDDYYLNYFDEDNNAQDIYVPEIEGVDKRCYRRTVEWVMKVAVKMTIRECKKTRCPFIRGWCKWAAYHKEGAFGMLLAKVEPEKYALGRCYNCHEEQPTIGDLLANLFLGEE